MIEFNIKETLHSFQKISHMSQNILQILVCLVSNIRKKPKGCYVSKALIIKPANVTMIKLLFHNTFSSLNHIFRHKKTIGKIIGTSCRNISDRNRTVYLHHTGDHLIKCAITATAYDKVYFRFVFFGFFIGISWFLCGIDDDFIATFIKYIYNIKQIGFYLTFACFGVENKEQFFVHFEQLSFFSEFENAYKKRYAISIYNNIKKKGGKVNGV